jgi:hypothetical protein
LQTASPRDRFQWARLPIAKQIAEALEAAHDLLNEELGIVGADEQFLLVVRLGVL